MKGLVPFYKPSGISSYDLIRRIKKWINESKIGHGGSLDPFAEGLIVIGIGKTYTKKLSEILKNSKKIYQATIELGTISTTDDIDGILTKKKNIKIPKESEIKNILCNFIGKIKQIPPLYSAKKIKGIPAYKRVRQGESFLLKPQKVTIYEIKIIKYLFPILKLEISTGSGVYIRSLARDIGNQLNTGAYLKELKRIKINDFLINNAITIKDIENDLIELWIKIWGIVQGVGFRFFLLSKALEKRIFGWCRNLKNENAIEIVAQGSEKNLQEFLEIAKIGPRSAKIEKINFQFQRPKEKFSDFKIIY